MGGMQVLQWAASYPERVFAALPIACATRHSAQNIAFHEVGRQAVMADPEWRQRPLSRSRAPIRAAGSRSRAWARTSPICRTRRCTANSAASSRTASNPTFSFDADFEVESYLRHQGIVVRRALRRQFLSLSDARDGLFRSRRRLRRRARQCLQAARTTRFCVVSFTSRLAVPDVGVARHRACAQRRRRAGLVRRDRHRQGPRRLPARRAGTVRDRARLPRRRRARRAASRRRSE